MTTNHVDVREDYNDEHAHGAMSSFSRRALMRRLAGAGLIAAGAASLSTTPHAAAEGGQYDREWAAAQAIAMLGQPYKFPQDCAFYVSSVLWSVGLPKSAEWTDWTLDPAYIATDWDLIKGGGPSKAASSAHWLETYLTVASGLATIRYIDWSDNTAAGAQLGDVISYDWDGDMTADHVAIVTNINDDGYPEVSQHDPTQKNRYWSWSLGSNNWIEHAYPGSLAFLIHITY